MVLINLTRIFKTVTVTTNRIPGCSSLHLEVKTATRQAMLVTHWDAFVQPLLLWKNNKNYIFWVCICSLRYPALNGHAPDCHLWPVRLYNIFPYYLIHGTIFENKLFSKKCVLIFSTTLVRNISHSQKNRTRYDLKYRLVSVYSKHNFNI